MDRRDAIDKFRSLSAEDQVSLYLWELQHTRPVASPYEFLLKEKGSEVARPLLEAANLSDGYLVQTALLATIAGLREQDRKTLPEVQLRSAIERCKSLAGHTDDRQCVAYERDLLP